MDTILTFDIGGSSLRTALFDVNGSLLQIRQESFAMEMDSSGGYQVDPDIWWQTFTALTGELLEDMTDQDISVLAVCGAGMTRCQIFLDKNGTPVFPAILWPDHRSREESLILKELAGQEKRWSSINEYHTLSRVLWFKNNFPELYQKTTAILEPKDYINFKLTGATSSDIISLSRVLREADLGLDKELMEKAKLRPGLFPEMKWPWQPLGKCQPLPAPLSLLETATVFTGGMDAWCSVIGTGVSTGDIYNVSGTSEVTGVITREKTWKKGLVTLPWGKDSYQIGGPSQVGGDALKWLSEILLPDVSHGGPEILASKVETYKKKQDAPLFIPYLRGERAPLWESTARGVFWNMHREHRQEDLIYAVMEGIGMASRYLLETAFEDQPLTGQVIISGKASKSDLWCQIRADILGLPVVRKDVTEAGLFGAFLLALVGLGRLDSIEQGQKKYIKTDRVFQPDTKIAYNYNRLYPHWKKTSLSMLKLHCDLQSEISE